MRSGDDFQKWSTSDAAKCCSPVKTCLGSIEKAWLKGDHTLTLHLVILMRDVAIQCKDDPGTELANSMLPAVTAMAFPGT